MVTGMGYSPYAGTVQDTGTKSRRELTYRESSNRAKIFDRDSRKKWHCSTGTIGSPPSDLASTIESSGTIQPALLVALQANSPAL